MDAEVFLEVLPVVVLQFQSNVCHEVRHPTFLEGSGQFLVTHRLVCSLQFRAGSVLEERFAQLVHGGAGILFLRIVVFQIAQDSAVLSPTGLSVINNRLGIHSNGRFR